MKNIYNNLFTSEQKKLNEQMILENKIIDEQIKNENQSEKQENNNLIYQGKKYTITHKTGRCRSGIDITGIISHAVIGNNSICGDNPKKRSGWSDYSDKIITCKKCLKLLEKGK